VSEGAFGRAPGGLEFVQAFVNTGYHTTEGGIDPLRDTDTARAWLMSALTRCKPQTRGNLVLDSLDVESLRGVRRAFTELIAHRRGSRALTATLGAKVDGDGLAVIESRGTGAGQVLGILLGEVFVAQQDGTWRRLKICRNDRCAIAFYDRSPNVSALWHNAKVCGNAINLRRSRSRRRNDEPT
jgi:hypothetical protein